MDQYFNQIIELFTPQQRLAIFAIVVSVMTLTQVFKKVYFGFFPERRTTRKAAIIWLFSFISGLSLGLLGYWAGEIKQPLWFWLFCGISSGGIAIGAYKLLIGVIWARLSKKPLQ